MDFNMNYITAEIMEYVGNEEKQIARLNLYCKPSIGEHLWINQGTGKQEAFVIKDFCHWASNLMNIGEQNLMHEIAYQKLAIYVDRLEA